MTETSPEQPAKCDVCGRERTPADRPYTIMQAATGQPCGWYSGDGEEVCGHDMDIMLGRQ